MELLKCTQDTDHEYVSIVTDILEDLRELIKTTSLLPEDDTMTDINDRIVSLEKQLQVLENAGEMESLEYAKVEESIISLEEEMVPPSVQAELLSFSIIHSLLLKTNEVHKKYMMHYIKLLTCKLLVPA